MPLLCLVTYNRSHESNFDTNERDTEMSWYSPFLSHPLRPSFESVFQTFDFLFVLFYLLSFGNGKCLIPQDIEISLYMSFQGIMIFFVRFMTIVQKVERRMLNEIVEFLL